MEIRRGNDQITNKLVEERAPLNSKAVTLGQDLGKALANHIISMAKTFTSKPSLINFTVTLGASRSDYSHKWINDYKVEIYLPKGNNEKALFESVVDVAALTFGEGFDQYKMHRTETYRCKVTIEAPSQDHPLTNEISLQISNESKTDEKNKVLAKVFCVACVILFGLWYSRRRA